MNRITPAALAMIMLALLSCTRRETPFHTGFETTEQATKLPRDWSVLDNGRYDIYADSLVAYNGKRSLLLQYRNGKEKPGQVGMGFLQVPVDFKGKAVTLRGFIKTEKVEDGITGLVMRIEGDADWTLSETMASKKVSGTGNWKQYEISLPLQPGARTIYFGAYSTGSGKVWVDNLELLVDGKEPGAEGRLTLLPALKDTAFRNASRVVIDSLSPALVNDLAVLGKIWGFLKYYHPAVAAGQYNWDFELFRVLPRIIAAGSKQERNSILLNWVKGLGLYKPGNGPAAPDSSMVKLQPDLAWLENREELGLPLSEELVSVSRSARPGNHFYISIQPTGNAGFINESRYSWLHFPDDGYRLLALYRYWNVIQYFFPYKYLIGENWTEVLHRFIPRFIQARSQAAYQLTALALVASIRDSHGNLTGNAGEISNFLGKYVVPAEVRFVEGKPTVVSVPKGTEGLLRGDVIRKVNDKTVQEIQDRLASYLSASNESQKLFRTSARLLRGNDSSFQVEVTRGGSTVKLQLHSSAMHFPYPAFDTRMYPASWKVLPGNVGYTFLGALKRDDVPQMMKKFLSTAGIVIDLRCYPLEMVGTPLCTYFVDKRVEYAKTSSASVQHPGLFVLQPTLKAGGRNTFPYRRKVAVLVNEFTMSRGEFVAMTLKAAPNVTIIGSTTAGADGDVSVFFLPGGLETRISGAGIYWPDGRETQQTGIVPDIVVQPTLKGVAAGKDEVLDFALAYVRK